MHNTQDANIWQHAAGTCSFKALHYFVTVIYECKEDPAVSVPVAEAVVHANCQPTDGCDPCQASGHGHKVVYDKCTHISALVQAALNLVRLDGVIGVKVPGTAALCAWNNPGEGATFAPGTRLASMAFVQPIYDRDAKPRNTCMSAESDRGQYNPIANPQHNLNPANDELMRLRGLLYESLRQDHMGFNTAQTAYRPARAAHGGGVGGS